MPGDPRESVFVVGTVGPLCGLEIKAVENVRIGACIGGDDPRLIAVPVKPHRIVRIAAVKRIIDIFGHQRGIAVRHKHGARHVVAHLGIFEKNVEHGLCRCLIKIVVRTIETDEVQPRVDEQFHVFAHDPLILDLIEPVHRFAPIGESGRHADLVSRQHRFDVSVLYVRIDVGGDRCLAQP